MAGAHDSLPILHLTSEVQVGVRRCSCSAICLEMLHLASLKRFETGGIEMVLERSSTLDAVSQSVEKLRRRLEMS